MRPCSSRARTSGSVRGWSRRQTQRNWPNKWRASSTLRCRPQPLRHLTRLWACVPRCPDYLSVRPWRHRRIPIGTPLRRISWAAHLASWRRCHDDHRARTCAPVPFGHSPHPRRVWNGRRHCHYRDQRPSPPGIWSSTASPGTDDREWRPAPPEGAGRCGARCEGAVIVFRSGVGVTEADGLALLQRFCEGTKLQVFTGTSGNIHASVTVPASTAAEVNEILEADNRVCSFNAW